LAFDSIFSLVFNIRFLFLFSNNKSKDINKKRKALMQEGTGIGLILSTVAPILASLISRAFTKK
jgi:hypothetical protein